MKVGFFIATYEPLCYTKKINNREFTIMKLRLEDKNKSIKLRIQGKTYREIQSHIPNLSKSTLSGWLKNIKLSSSQKEKLEKNIANITNNARLKSAWTKKEQRLEKINKLFALAEKEYVILSKNSLFLLGLTLYWGEGNKKTQQFQFTNSDPHAIRAMMRWLTEIHKVPKEKIKIRLYTHKLYAHEKCEKFWSEITNIPVNQFQKTIYKQTIHKIKKNPDYKGCIQLRVLKSEFYWKTMGWLQAMIKKFDF